MNFRPMLLGAAMFALATCAHAEILHFNFSATITYTDGSLAGVTQGDRFTGHFAYDALTPGDEYYPGFVNYFFGAGSAFNAQIGNHSINSHGTLIAGVTDNFGGNVEDVFNLDASQVSINGKELAGGYWGFQLASGAGSTNVFTSTALPRSFDLAAFDAGPTLNYGAINGDGGRTTVLQYQIDTIANAVPEPETYALLLGGIALLVARQRQRKQA